MIKAYHTEKRTKQVIVICLKPIQLAFGHLWCRRQLHRQSFASRLEGVEATVEGRTQLRQSGAVTGRDGELLKAALAPAVLD